MTGVTLRAVENKSLPDKVFEQLMTEIVSGRYAPGSTIRSERALSEVFAVNRHVVREALKRLEQAGLVRIVQGGNTKVLDFRRTAGLDLLAVVAEHADAVEGLPPLLQAALEMRAGIGLDIAQLCAQRASQTICDRLVEVGEQLALVARGPALLPLDQLFWQHMLDGADNLAYQLAFNSLIRGVHAIPELSVPWLEHELERSDYRRPIAAAIAAGDSDAAVSATRAALAPAAELFASLMRAPTSATG
jgi:GntR family transcriptional regulator, transcriptional repressor for pyruvate dehydrogenase complex